MNPQPDTTRAALAALTLAALHTLPRLSVTVTPHTPHPWLVDYCCQRIWLDADLDGAQLVAACQEAIADLHAHAARPAAFVPQQRRGSSVPVP